MATTQPQFPIINVVPPGFRVTDDAIKAAAERGGFIRVGGNQAGRRTLSGAKRAWSSDKPEENRSIFLLDYRVTGTPENVTTALQYAGVAEDEINRAIANAVTRENYQTTKAEEYQAELDRYAATRRTKPAVEGYDWEQILWFGQNIKSAQIGTKTGEARGAVAVGGRAGTTESLADKLRKLGPGKVLDVSNMDLATGKGVRTVPAPKTAKSGKFGTNRVPIISNKVDQYVRALELAYGADAQIQFAQDIQQVRQALTMPGAQMAAPQGQGVTQVRPPSPPRVPSPALGATIAPAPTFQAPRVTTPRIGTIGGAGLADIPPISPLTRQ